MKRTTVSTVLVIMAIIGMFFAAMHQVDQNACVRDPAACQTLEHKAVFFDMSDGTHWVVFESDKIYDIGDCINSFDGSMKIVKSVFNGEGYEGSFFSKGSRYYQISDAVGECEL